MNKSERRKAMPESTKFIDTMRETFGELKGIHAEENGHAANWGERIEGKSVVADVWRIEA